MVFLSYNSKDKSIADKIAESLLQNSVEVWYDRWNILAGESLLDKIEEGLNCADAFIILMSNQSVSSNWVREELKIALTKRRELSTFIIIPVLLENCKIPLFLKDIRYVNWHSAESDPLIEIVSGLKKIYHKPATLPELYPRVKFINIIYKVKFSGYRGSVVKFTELINASAILETSEIDKFIDSPGIIKDVWIEGLSLERIKNSSYKEHWKLRPLIPILQNQVFNYNLHYSIFEGFVEDENSWTYGIESPTDKLTVIFDFTDTTDIDKFDIKHKIGAGSFSENVKPVKSGKLFSWTKILPEYRDTYDFVFKWKD